MADLVAGLALAGGCKITFQDGECQWGASFTLSMDDAGDGGRFPPSMQGSLRTGRMDRIDDLDKTDGLREAIASGKAVFLLGESHWFRLSGNLG